MPIDVEPSTSTSTGAGSSESTAVVDEGSESTADMSSTSTSSGGSSTADEDGSSSSSGVPVVCDDGRPDEDGVCLIEASSFGVSDGPVAVVTGDFDGDGLVDIVTASLEGDLVTLLAGDGLGGFAEPVDTPLGEDAEPVALAAGLLSDDGVSDVLVANRGHNTVSILHGGSEGFTIETLPTGGAPSDVAIVDLNGGGGLDIAVVNAEDDVLSTWIAVSDGGYHLADVSDGGPIPVLDTFVFGQVAAGGALDVVFAGDLVVGASPGAGDGTIDETVVVVANVPAPVTRMGGGDANDDGELDVVLATTGGIVVLIGDGNGGTAEFDSTVLGQHDDVVDALLMDVTGEGNEDVVAVARGDAELIVYPGKGDGTFDAPTLLAVGDDASGVTAADLDGDDVKEVLVVDALDGSVTVFEANP